MMNFQFFELMDSYSRGRMSERERIDFESQLQINKSLAQEWADYMLIARSVRKSISSKSGSTSSINHLVKDARDLARENGLLLTDEDIWLYFRGKLSQDLSSILGKRMASDKDYKLYVERESIIVDAIRKNASKLKMIQNVRDTLNREGFTHSLHEKIQSDIRHEEQSKKRAVSSNGNSESSLLKWGLSLLALFLIAAVSWKLLFSGPEVEYPTELNTLRTQITKIDFFASKGPQPWSDALSFTAKNLPDAALVHTQRQASGSKSPEWLFIESVAFMEKGDMANAQKGLRLLEAMPLPEDIRLKTLWCLALCAQKSEDHEKTQQYLQKIIAEFSNKALPPPEVEKAIRWSNALK